MIYSIKLLNSTELFYTCFDFTYTNAKLFDPIMETRHFQGVQKNYNNIYVSFLENKENVKIHFPVPLKNNEIRALARSSGKKKSNRF